MRVFCVSFFQLIGSPHRGKYKSINARLHCIISCKIFDEVLYVTAHIQHTFSCSAESSLLLLKMLNCLFSSTCGRGEERVMCWVSRCFLHITTWLQHHWAGVAAAETFLCSL